jgi:hypothetical protein
MANNKTLATTTTWLQYSMKKTVTENKKNNKTVTKNNVTQKTRIAFAYPLILYIALITDQNLVNINIGMLRS